MFKKILIMLSITVVSLAGFTKVAKAEEIIISGNGDGSSSQVNISVENNTTVTQSNQATVENNVTENANTGENTASGNSGSETNIQTGSVSSETNISNENINTNIAENQCCNNAQTNIQISGNGSDSVNTVNASITSDIDISQENTATIINSVTVNANTGNNTADNNLGNVTIETGKITALTNIENKNINLNDDPEGENKLTYMFKIFGNGEGSENKIIFTHSNLVNVSEKNFLTLTNSVFHNLNTGENSANGNHGLVFIKTGDIDSKINIKNLDINTNIARVDCCEYDPGDDNPPPPPPPPSPPPVTPPPPPPPGGGNGGGPGDGRSDGRSDGGSSGSSIAAVLGAMLPATGNYLTFLLTILATILFMLGVCLRMASGSSPPAAVKV